MQFLWVSSTWRTRCRVLPSDVAASGHKTLATGLAAPENLLSAVFVRYGTKMACLYMKTQCATSPVELRSLSNYTLKKNL